MATLPTNFKDDILDTSVNTRRRYRMYENTDGTIELEDVTEYSQVGDAFGAGQINSTNTEVNKKFDKNMLVRDLDTINAITKEGYAPDALALKEVNQSLQALSLKEITVITMTLPSSLDIDTRQELPSGFTYDNAVILSSMVNNGTGWQLSEPNAGFVTGIVNTNMVYIYPRSSSYINRPVKIVLGRY